MPCFQIQYELKNDDEEPDGAQAPAGAFATRWVRHSDREVAVNIGADRIRIELARAGVWERWSVIAAESASVDWWTYLRNAPGRGFTFYAED